MCLTVDITTASCPKGRAGINKIDIAPCEDVADITFDAADGSVTAITMVGLAVFLTIEFEKNTAFFNQPKTRVKNGVNIVQTISFIEPGTSIALRDAITDLNDCCCYIAIVHDNNGNRHLVGITYDKATDTYTVEDLKTGEGSWNSGADPTADAAEFTETLVANTGVYAPLLDPATVIP